jgi:dihydrodipicolinate synthase/N-acetylneuraminate lyase
MKLQGIFVDTTTPFDHNGDLYCVKIEHNTAELYDALWQWSVDDLEGFWSALWEYSGLHSPTPYTRVVDRETMPGAKWFEGAQVNLAAEHGFVAALVETPHYEKLLADADTQQLYFRSVADRASIPILISSRPDSTGVDLSIETMLALSSHPNIHGIVDHSGDCARAQRLGAFVVLCGVERVLWNALQNGASGAVLPFANAAPYAAIALWEAYRTREEEAGLDWQARIAPPAELLNTRYGVSGLKHAMDLNGYYGGLASAWTAPSPAASAKSGGVRGFDAIGDGPSLIPCQA